MISLSLGSSPLVAFANLKGRGYPVLILNLRDKKHLSKRADFHIHRLLGLHS